MNDEQEVEEVKSEVIDSEPKPGIMGIVSLVLGIVALLCCWLPFMNFALGIAALVLGILELKKIKEKTSSEKGRIMAIIGIVLGGVMVLWGIIFIILTIVFSFNLPEMYQSWY